MLIRAAPALLLVDGMVEHHAAILDVMVATESLFPRHEPTDAEEPRVVLHGVPWSTYVVLRDSVDSRGIVMTYLDGKLEIMTKSRRHEVTVDRLRRLVELFCLERDIPLHGYGQMTLRRRRRHEASSPISGAAAAKTASCPTSPSSSS